MSATAGAGNLQATCVEALLASKEVVTCKPVANNHGHQAHFGSGQHLPCQQALRVASIRYCGLRVAMARALQAVESTGCGPRMYDLPAMVQRSAQNRRHNDQEPVYQGLSNDRGLATI